MDTVPEQVYPVRMPDTDKNAAYPHIVVVAAVIERDGAILCARRKAGGETGGRWEFPGGKVEPGETREGALRREIDEELSLRVTVGAPVMTVEHRYESFSISLHAYEATAREGEPIPREHQELRWLPRGDLRALDWAPADRPVAELLAGQPSCPFCRVPKEERYYDGPLVFGIWDARPVSPGHALLIPKRHVPGWFDASPEERAELMAATDHARAAIEATYSPDGYNIGVNVGEAAGQTVFHLHVHVIPRYSGDVHNPRGGVRHVLPRRAGLG